MKIAAIIEEFNGFGTKHQNFIRQVREISQADYVIAIMSGDFIQQGIPALENKYDRAKKAVLSGVDLVIELPVFGVLSSPDTYAYAAVSMLDSLRCVDEVYIPCDTSYPNLLFDAARFLFMENRDYQLRLRNFRIAGMSFYDAQARAVGMSIQGGGEILQNPVNIFSAEYLRALKRLYSQIVPRLIQAPDLSPKSRENIWHKPSAYLSSLLKYALFYGPKNMDEIYGGTSMLTQSILQARESYDSFDTFCARLKTPTRSQANIRRYMLNMILNMRKSDIAICRLYGFSLYFRGLCARPGGDDLADYIRSHTWTPLFFTTPQSWDHVPKEADPAIQRIASLDVRAHKLYILSRKN